MDILGASSSEAFSIFGYCESYYSLIIFREVSFVSEGHRKPETYRANLCDEHKFCASRSVLLRAEGTVTCEIYERPV